MWVQIPARDFEFFIVFLISHPILYENLRRSHKNIFLISHILSYLLKKNLLLCSKYKGKKAEELVNNQSPQIRIWENALISKSMDGHRI